MPHHKTARLSLMFNMNKKSNMSWKNEEKFDDNISKSKEKQFLRKNKVKAIFFYDNFSKKFLYF